jgi:hypothetical protein
MDKILRVTPMSAKAYIGLVISGWAPVNLSKPKDK